MKNFIRQYCKVVALAAFVLIVMIVIIARNNSWIGLNFSAKNTDTTTEQTGANNLQTGIVRTGFVRTPVLLPVCSGFAGRISELYVKEGQPVKSGQALFKLEAIQITGNSPAISTASESALKEYNRFQKLYEQGAISRRELENAATRLSILQKSLPNGQSAAGGTAPVITNAPIEGVVTNLAVEAGAAVQVDQPIMSLGSGQSLEVVVPLEQNDLYWVQPGTPATIEAAGHIFVGEVASIFPEIKDNSISSFQAHINLDSFPADLLQVGMSVNVRISSGP